MLNLPGTEMVLPLIPDTIAFQKRLLSALLDQPHTADVRALETSQFYVADAAAMLVQDPTALLYIAAVLARRLDGANRALIELKSQLQAGQPLSVIGKTVEKMGASLVYAGYPTDPYT